LFWPWVILGSLCTLLMWMLPGEETVPYHLAWIGIATAYGLETWPRFRTVFSIATFTVATGAILVVRAATGVIAWQETAEIPLMSILMLLMVWHVLRRQLALAALTEMVDRERSRATQRERLSRMTSHEMRTPATIAMGYVDLLLVQEQDSDRRADLEVVIDELERLILASDRLVRMLWIPDQDGLQEVDLDGLLADTAERWSVLADRDWKVTSSSGLQYCSLDRIRACLDTLIENAVRYTNEGDVVRLISFVRDGHLMVGVADSGPGLEPGVAASINEMREDASVAATFTAADPKAQTGLGLGLVREAVAARGGKILAGRSDDGGASVLMVLPTGDREAVSASWPEGHPTVHGEPEPTASLHLDGTYR
jgi:signal transduction histidine kinase